MGNKEVQRPSILLKGTDIPRQSYSLGDYLDPEELETEYKRLSKELQNASDNLYRYATIPDHKSQAEWDTLQEKPEQLTNAFLSLHQRIEDSPQGQTANGINLTSVLFTACALLTYKALEQQKKFAEKHDFLYFFEPWHQFRKFLFTGNVHIKLGDASILDMVNDSNLAPSSVFKFAMEAYFVRNRKTHTKILAENQTPLTIAYPNLTKQHIQLASGEAMALVNTGSRDLDLLFREFFQETFQGTDKEIAQAAKEVVKRTLSLRAKILHTILDPNSSEFPPLKEMVEKYLEDESEIRSIAILRLGLNNYNAISYVYRATRELARFNDDNSLFYTRLSSAIRDFMEEFPSITILTKDDLPSIIDINYNSKNPVSPSSEDLRKIVGLIFQNSSKREYAVGPEKINWGDLVSPTSVRVEFLKNTPSKFMVLLHYQNKEGDVLDLPLLFDTKKGELDWGFLESPKDQEMEALGEALLLVTQSILLNIQQQAESEYQQRQNERQTQIQAPQATTRQSRPKELYVPRKKATREKRPIPLTPLQEILQSEIPFPIQPEQQGIKNQIVSPQNEDLEKMMKNFSSGDIALVIKGIEGYNQRAVGQFKMLRLPGKQGQNLFTLRVNCGTGGDIRVLLQESTTTTDSPNLRTFEILDIDYRKNIYRRRQLE